MEKFLTILFVNFMISISLFSQAPQSFNYQAVARDISGNVLVNTTVAIKISILNGSVNGTAQYVETQNPQTNQFGLFNLEIGKGTVKSGTFTSISWSNGLKFIKIEMDSGNGTNYSLVGTSQLLSVPYSLQSNNTLQLQGFPVSASTPIIGQTLMWNGTNWIPVNNQSGTGKGSNAATLIYLGNF